MMINSYTSTEDLYERPLRQIMSQNDTMETFSFKDVWHVPNRKFDLIKISVLRSGSFSIKIHTLNTFKVPPSSSLESVLKRVLQTVFQMVSP